MIPSQAWPHHGGGARSVGRRSGPVPFGREFAAFLELVPRQNSSGGKERLGRASRMAKGYLRKLLNGGGGLDTLYGDNGDDTLTGGAGNDSLYGGNGVDTAVFSGSLAASYTVEYLPYGDIERLHFADQDIVLSAVAGVNLSAPFSGGSLTGTDGKDHLFGSDFNDTLSGGANADALYGRDGDDVLSGGAGADYLTGGAGNDTFVLEPSAGATLTLADVITDFSAGDHLGLSGGLTYNNLIVAQGVGDHAADTIVSTTGGAYLAILQNVDHNSITAASFAMI